MPRREGRAGALPGTALGLILAAAAANPATAEDREPGSLGHLERTLEEERARVRDLDAAAAALGREIAVLQSRLVAAARAAQEREEQLSALERRLAALGQAEREKAAQLARRRAELAATLAGLQRLALQPPQAMLLRRGGPLDKLRSAMLLRIAVPALEGRGQALLGELAALAELRAEIERQRTALQRAALALATENREIGTLLAEKAKLQRQTDAEQRQRAEKVAALANEARDLRELLATLARPPLLPEPAPPASPQQAALPDGREPAAAEPPAQAMILAVPRLDPPATRRPFPRDGDGLLLPARGVLVGHYGEPAESGLERKGIAVRTRPDAQVVAPFDGQIVFRGPFRGYGEILIIEHAGGYHTVLAGLDRTDGLVGQWLVAGEPVGRMGSDEGEGPELYVELRRGGQPVNPLPWLPYRGSEQTRSNE